MEMSDKMLLIVLIYISGAIMLDNITQYQLKHVINFCGMIFRCILNIFRNRACTFLLTFKMYSTLLNNNLRLQSLQQESLANAKVSARSSACMKAPSEEIYDTKNH